MDPRLLRFDVFASPKQKQPNGLLNLNFLPKFGERSVTSLLKYKNEPMRQSVPSKQVDSYLFIIKPSQPTNTPSKLSYSNSIKYIENFPESKLDSKVVKLLQPRYLKSGFSTKRLRFDQQGSQQQQISQKSEESVTYNVKYKFAQQAVKSQVKANLLFFKKSKNIPAQIQLLNRERVNSLKQKMATTLPGFKGSSPEQTIKFNTYRENFLKSQKINLYQKKQVESNNKVNVASKHHKQTNSVQTQILFDEFGREISSFNYQFNNEQFN